MKLFLTAVFINMSVVCAAEIRSTTLADCLSTVKCKNSSATCHSTYDPLESDSSVNNAACGSFSLKFLECRGFESKKKIAQYVCCDLRGNALITGSTETADRFCVSNGQE